MDQTKTPYFQALLDYVDSGVLPFHTPGHIQGNGMDLAFREFVGDNICAIDLTPMPGIDDLLQPVESIREAQELAAEAWGADRTFFLINGSTSGNQCMMMTAANPGDEIAVPRNSHKSMLGGLVMSGARPIYMQPGVDEQLHMDHCVTPETVAETLREHPSLTAVYLVSPTYYGVAADLAAIERIVHDAGKLLLVDEAWGPHFHFHPALPLSATAAGADLCINSTHKMLSAFSQCAMLHQKGERVRVDRLKAVLKMFLSTSPNLPMVASLDVARKQMATEGAALLTSTIELAQETRRRINRIPGLYCLGEDLIGRNGVFDLDPTKITVTVKALGYTGYEASEILRHRYNIQVELADLFNVVALFTIGTTPQAAERLALAFEEMARDERPVDLYARSGILERRLNRGSYQLPKIPPMRMSPRDAFLAETEFVKFKDSKGRICAETISPYPPGIPVIAPGEEITADLIAYLRLEIKAGVRIQGTYDDALRIIRVVKE
ncbi:MAG: aminotransferase class I/II-fold pyridoxal phosphate-dependent enzyme [Candidatus Eremiobacteraeota bacterium]|nr:aminotransferase class I/II-fold pyridoxal phosphate-dependent enzyme [Candidatus Eremiobacteraeota bacterium]MBV8372928.1 aminotransferase class I/II-fold pyridoxal phosphate-dependent enzyme [Candidatus Eremiobacteraeota bacterium]